ncbi:MAG: hypothetical protein CM15mP44_2060 [Candidatus Neomarinimicrobiota bacterium]|nr:MAG: hypothetical protein CM15mP44_2060 [Candidatus Neomarinimicrobiota bacterium]
MSSVDIFIEKDYAVISSFEEDASDFVLKVNELMQQGWRISGGISSPIIKYFKLLLRLLNEYSDYRRSWGIGSELLKDLSE